MRKLVLGDVHGAYRALKQVLRKSKFDYEKDQLIFLGDLVDGWVDVRACFDEFLKIKNLVFVMGNHDEWALNWMIYGSTPIDWVSQGGSATIRSFSVIDPYTANSVNLDPYISLLRKSVYCYIDDNRLFVHGGIPTYYKANISAKAVHKDDLMWDRTLQEYARKLHFGRHLEDGLLTRYREVYVGHTTTERYSLEPQNWMNIWNLDQGAGWSGKLSLMDVNTKEYWQSDRVTDLYPERGRAR